MLINREREKLINAILFFAINTRYLGKTKLCKLLYFLDFEHFKETGRSVTGLEYSAWKMGPVPVELFEEIDMPEPDMAAKVSFLETQTSFNTPMCRVHPIAEFDDSHFSKRELRIMERLAGEYKESPAEDMIEATHLQNEPWHKIYIDEGKKQQLIPYNLAILKQEAEEMAEAISERDEFIKHLS